MPLAGLKPQERSRYVSLRPLEQYFPNDSARFHQVLLSSAYVRHFWHSSVEKKGRKKVSLNSPVPRHLKPVAFTSVVYVSVNPYTHKTGLVRGDRA